MLNAGDIVGHHFQIDEEAGRGGMGVVYRATDRRDGQTVALKLLHANAQGRARFLREAEVLGELDHPGIVRYVAHGSHPRPAGGDPDLFLVMEWLDGMDLDERLESGPALSVAEVVTMAHRVALALDLAHQKGIIHRDIKPGNIFLNGNNPENVKILDFGIAHAAAAARMTQTGTAMGTPGFMAPEQATGTRDIDGRADLFALGSVLYQCLTGEPAYDGAHAMAILTRMLFEEPPRVDEVREDLPGPLVDLVSHFMEREKEERPESASEAAAMLAALKGLSDVGDAARSEVTLAITDQERRLVNVIIADTTRSVRDTLIQSRESLGSAPTLQPKQLQLGLLKNIAERYGGRMEVMHDGSVVILLAGDGMAPEQGRRAAQCALSLRGAYDDAPVVVATGWAEVGRRVPYGEVIDNAYAMLNRDDVAYPAHGVVVCDVTTRLLADRFEILEEEVGHVLTGRPLRMDSGIGQLLGNTTPCLGRRRELALLDATYYGCKEDHTAAAVIVSGEPGIGKSRLRREFIRRLQEDGEVAEVIVATAELKDDVGAPYAVLAGVLRREVGIYDDDPVEVRREKLEEHAHSLTSDQQLARRGAVVLGESLGLPFEDEGDPFLAELRGDKQKASRALKHAYQIWLRGLVKYGGQSRDGVTILIVDDLQWADIGSVQAIDSLLESCEDQPLMVLALARPEWNDRFESLWESHDVTELTLRGLSRGAAEKLVRSVLGDEVESTVLDSMIDKANGNAFFLEELIRSVAEGRKDLPETVLGTVQRRLSALDPEARRTLRAASVFGEQFWLGGVTALVGGKRRTGTVKDWLSYLENEEVIEQRSNSSFAHDIEYRFRHALIRDGAYAALTLEDRQLAHRLAAGWFEKMGESNPARLGRHRELGGEPDKAAAYYCQAAEAALLAADSGSSVMWAERGLQIANSPDVIAKLHRARVEGEGWGENLLEMADKAIEAIEHQEVGSTDWFIVMEILLAALDMSGEIEEHGRWLTRALQTEPLTPRAAGRKMVVLCRNALYALWAGHRDLGDALLEDAHTLSKTAEFAYPTLKVWLGYASAIHKQFARDLGGALREGRRAMELSKSAGDIRGMVGTGAVIGTALMQMGMWKEAQHQLSRVMETLKQADMEVMTDVPNHNLATCLFHLGNRTEALSIKRHVLTRMKHGRLRGRVMLSLAELLLEDEQNNEALEKASRACEILVDYKPVYTHALAVKARAELRHLEFEKGLETATQAKVLLDELKGGLEAGTEVVWLAFVEALRSNARNNAADAALRQALELIRATRATLESEEQQQAYVENVPEVAALWELREEVE